MIFSKSMGTINILALSQRTTYRVQTVPPSLQKWSKPKSCAIIWNGLKSWKEFHLRLRKSLRNFNQKYPGTSLVHFQSQKFPGFKGGAQTLIFFQCFDGHFFCYVFDDNLLNPISINACSRPPHPQKCPYWGFVQKEVQCSENYEKKTYFRYLFFEKWSILY